MKKVIIPEGELQFSYAKSAGPGGQNVNKLATKAVLHWDVKRSPSISDEVRFRFIRQNHTRIRKDGVLVLHSRRFRTRKDNVQACKLKLLNLLKEAAKEPKLRKKTKPSKASKEKRLSDKKKHGLKKQLRGPVTEI